MSGINPLSGSLGDSGLIKTASFGKEHPIYEAGLHYLKGKGLVQTVEKPPAEVVLARLKSAGLGKQIFLSYNSETGFSVRELNWWERFKLIVSFGFIRPEDIDLKSVTVGKTDRTAFQYLDSFKKIATLNQDKKAKRKEAEALAKPKPVVPSQSEVIAGPMGKEITKGLADLEQIAKLADKAIQDGGGGVNRLRLSYYQKGKESGFVDNTRAQLLAVHKKFVIASEAGNREVANRLAARLRALIERIDEGLEEMQEITKEI